MLLVHFKISKSEVSYILRDSNDKIVQANEYDVVDVADPNFICYIHEGQVPTHDERTES